jgi:energy-coupling factor transporter transmembrane protein EcfT
MYDIIEGNFLFFYIFICKWWSFERVHALSQLNIYSVNRMHNLLMLNCLLFLFIRLVYNNKSNQWNKDELPSVNYSNAREGKTSNKKNHCMFVNLSEISRFITEKKINQIIWTVDKLALVYFSIWSILIIIMIKVNNILQMNVQIEEILDYISQGKYSDKQKISLHDDSHWEISFECFQEFYHMIHPNKSKVFC